MVVEAEPQPGVAHPPGEHGNPRHGGVRLLGGGRRSDPGQHEAVGSDRSELAGEPVQIGLDRVEARVPAADREPELVEQRPHLVGAVAVQVEELDPLVADLADGTQRPFEVARALGAERVQHQSDTAHPSISRRTKWPGRSSTGPVGTSGS